MNAKAMKIAGVLFISVVSIIIGYLIGIKKDINDVNSFNQNSSANNKNQNYSALESTAIAVVNLDEGTELESNKMYYSEKVLQFPTTDFSYTSLSEAESGMQNGTYGGYIIIPSEFSKNIESLNSTPKITDIEYTINNALSGEAQYDILYNILSFSNIVNNNLSYMYVDNILEELHTAQDNAKIVMENDEEDWDTINALKEGDLVRVVKLPELEQTELDIEQLDVIPLSDSNDKCADNLDKRYAEYVSDIESDLNKLEKSGKTLTSKLKKMSTEVSKFDALIDKDGNKIEDTAKKAVSDAVDNSYVSSKKNYTGYIDNIEKSYTNFSKEYQSVLKALNQTMTADSVLQMDIVTDYVINNLPEIEINKSGNVVVITFKDDSVKNNSEDNTIPNIEIKTSSSEEYIAKIKLMEFIVSGLKTYTSADIILGTPTDASNSSSNVYEEIIRNCDENKDVKAYLSCLKLTSTEEFINNISEKENYISDSSELEIEGDKSKLNDYLKKVIQEADIGQFVKNTFADATEYEKNLGECILATKKNVKNFVPINSDLIISAVNKGYILPIKSNLDSFNKKSTTRYTDEIKEISTYNNIINAFAPNYDISFVDENISKIRENNLNILSDTLNNNSLYIDYANQVYQDTSDNIQLLQKSISEADTESAKALNDGLAGMKLMKENNNAENQSVLKDFSEILSYTRLGSLEYRQAYEFIVEPNNFKLNSVSLPIENGTTKAEIKLKEKAEQSNFINIFLVLLFIILFAGGLLVYGIRKHKSKSWQ